MHRIDTDGNVNGLFTDTPAEGANRTVVDDDWLNAVQEELCAAIEARGITLDKTKHNQLTAALATVFTVDERSKLSGIAASADVTEDTLKSAAEVEDIADTDSFPAIISSALKRISFSNLKAKLKAYFDGLYIHSSWFDMFVRSAVPAGGVETHGELSGNLTLAAVYNDLSPWLPAIGNRLQLSGSFRNSVALYAQRTGSDSILLRGCVIGSGGTNTTVSKDNTGESMVIAISW